MNRVFFFFTYVSPSLPLCAEFAPGSRTREVAEPGGSTPLTVTLTVRRLGGTVGVIQAVWNVTSSDGMPTLIHDYFTGKNFTSHKIIYFSPKILAKIFLFFFFFFNFSLKILHLCSLQAPLQWQTFFLCRAHCSL